MLKLSKIALAGLLLFVAFGCTPAEEAEKPVPPPTDTSPPAKGPDGKELTPQAAPGSAGTGGGGEAGAGSMTMPPPPTN